LALVVIYVKAHETYCYDPALIVNNVRTMPAALAGRNQTGRPGFVQEATGTPAIALQRCPASGWFHYYDCCDDEDKRRCCFNFRWFFLLLFIIPWVLLLLFLFSAMAYFCGRGGNNRGKRHDNVQRSGGVHAFGNPNRENIHSEYKAHAKTIPIGGEHVETHHERHIVNEHNERDIPINRVGADKTTFERTVY